MQAYNAPQKGKELVMPLPEEGSKQRDEVKRAFTPPPPPSLTNRLATSK